MADANVKGSAHPVFTGRRGALLVAFCALMALASLTGMFDRGRAFGLFGAEISGAEGFHWIEESQNFQWKRVSQVYPGGAADAVAIEVGDHVRFERPWRAYSRHRAGQIVPLTVEHHGRSRHVELVIRPFSLTQFDAGTYSAIILDLFSSLAALLLAGVVLWRGWGRLAALALGLGQIGTSFSSSLTLPYWVESHGGAIFIDALLATSLALRTSNILVPFVLYHEVGKQASPAWFHFYRFYCAVFIASAVATGLWLLGLLPYTGGLVRAISAIGGLTAIYWAWRGLRDAGPERERFRAILLAFALAGTSLVVFALLDYGLKRRIPSLADPLVLVAYLVPTSFPFLVAWAILRHKAIDLGFAINRTLVYGMLSAVLLASFGLLEWAAHHLLPEEWAKANSWIDGAIALGLFLVFHRVRDWVEHRVEHWFFHDWQQNEAKLRRFVASAGHFEHRDALVGAFAAELARFCGVPAAIYVREGAGLALAGGEWIEAPPAFPSDDPAFALLRAERRPLDLTDTPTDLPGTLALPMLDHGVLTGVALLPAKADGALYRPDEVEVLGWAALQIGLDLVALRARRLEIDNDRLAVQVETLTALLRTPRLPESATSASGS